ncbi:MAG: carbohydrate kinase [Methanobacterium sp.]|uniref:PfkB family carbohydrate kinase n=1 Tax=Methanobacterium sp. TaxID=2164 RepID=UPI003D65697E|nr:carbohydrate kinase [Methanobacterium sp.]
MSSITLIGPVTEDIIKKDDADYKLTGGAVYYQCSVLSNLKINTNAVITISKDDIELLKSFPDDVKIIPILVDETVKFKNIYPDNNPNHRIQKACIPHNPININDISESIKNSDALLLGPLSPYDIPLKTIKELYKLGIPLYLGAQGYLRHLEGNKIVLKPWEDFKKFLKYIKILFIDENEAKIILGKNIPLGLVAKKLTLFGPEEVIITLGSSGSLIYSKKLDKLYEIPSFTPKKIEDPTGLGDTYMAAYTARKLETDNPKLCGLFASAASVIKLENKGAFNGNKKLIKEKCKNFK